MDTIAVHINFTTAANVNGREMRYTEEDMISVNTIIVNTGQDYGKLYLEMLSTAVICIHQSITS